MFHNKRLIISVAALAFSFSMLSLGYGFWTDSLDLEGNADVNLSIRVIDDVEETTTPEALVLTEEPILTPDGGDIPSPAELAPSVPDPGVTPPITDPGATPPVQDPVITPQVPVPVITPPVPVPVITPSVPDPVITPPEATEDNGEGNPTESIVTSGGESGTDSNANKTNETENP